MSSDRDLRKRPRPPRPLRTPEPAIQSIGLPPEIHAERIIAAMPVWLIGERRRLDRAMASAVRATKSRLGATVAQVKFAERLRKAGGPAILEVDLKPGKRGNFNLTIVEWDATRAER